MNFIFSLSFTKNDGESKKLLFWLKSDFKVNPNIGLTENKKSVLEPKNAFFGVRTRTGAVTAIFSASNLR